MFVVLEGIDGSGKTTQWELLRDNLDRRRWLCVKEPGSTPVGELCREALKASSLSSEERILLFSAARAALVRQVITPALRGGINVLCDRYLPSMFAYQASRSRFPRFFIWDIFRFTEGIMPDMVIYLDVSPELAMARIKDRGRTALDPVSIEDLYQIKQEYTRVEREWSTEHGCEWFRIRGDQDQFTVFRSISRILEGTGELSWSSGAPLFSLP